MLRQLGEPITLFGEKEMERRERLRRTLAQQEAVTAELPAVGQVVVQEMAPAQKEKFWTEGPMELKAARAKIAQWSLQRAAARIGSGKRRRDDPGERVSARSVRLSAHAHAKHITQQSSEIGDERPISGCEFSPNGSMLATCGWGGALSVWDVADNRQSRCWVARANEERCTDVVWHPSAQMLPQDVVSSIKGEHGVQGEGGMSTLALATASVDRTARLFSGTGKLLRILVGHEDRLARMAFHPMGKHLATASFDMTWRMWDVETGQCLMEQEGHSRPVYTVAFHPDGSLAASAGLDSIGRLWDCRTGRSIWTLEGHIKQVLAMDFSPNGYQVVTGSDDHQAKVWDLRARKCVYTIPGHRSLISSAHFEHSSGGQYIVTGGYDGLVKVWSSKDFKLLRTLAGHEGKVMAVDSSPAPNSHLIASVSYDRTVKLWAPEGVEEEKHGDAMEL